MKELTINDFEKYTDQNEYEVFDEESQSWKSYKSSCYLSRINGFPNPRSAAEKIQLISCKRRGQKTITFAWRPVESEKILNCEYRRCHDEKSMLVAFVTWLNKNPPDVITGWNIEGFDIPYICRRIENVLGPETVQQLSPFGFVYERDVEVMGRQELRYDICGIAILDYMALYRKFTFKARESYKLDYICEVEIGAKKLDHSEFPSFSDFYNGNPTVICEPNKNEENYEYKMKAYNLHLIQEELKTRLV